MSAEVAHTFPCLVCVLTGKTRFTDRRAGCFNEASNLAEEAHRVAFEICV